LQEARLQAQKAEENLSKLEGLLAAIKPIESGFNSSVSVSALSTAKGLVNAHFDQIIKSAEENRSALLSKIDQAAASKYQELQRQALQVTSIFDAFRKYEIEALRALELSDYEICAGGCEDKLTPFPNGEAFEPSVDISIPCFLNTSVVITAIQGSGVGVPYPPSVAIEPSIEGFKVAWQVPDLLPQQPALKYYKVKVLAIETEQQVTSLAGKERNNIYDAEAKTVFEVLQNPSPSLLFTDRCFEGQKVTAAVMACDINGNCSDWSWSAAVKLGEFQK